MNEENWIKEDKELAEKEAIIFFQRVERKLVENRETVDISSIRG